MVNDLYLILWEYFGDVISLYPLMGSVEVVSLFVYLLCYVVSSTLLVLPFAIVIKIILKRGR